MAFKPPKCPGCKGDLVRIVEASYEGYEFDEKTGTYHASWKDSEIRCSHCSADLYDIFATGVRNYQSD